MDDTKKMRYLSVQFQSNKKDIFVTETYDRIWLTISSEPSKLDHSGNEIIMLLRLNDNADFSLKQPNLAEIQRESGKGIGY